MPLVCIQLLDQLWFYHLILCKFSAFLSFYGAEEGITHAQTIKQKTLTLSQLTFSSRFLISFPLSSPTSSIKLLFLVFPPYVVQTYPPNSQS
ncbi:hypothetical protein O6H91_19G082700 [Diphasiastrum complanatum]|uniref:Uncharacterized protein n=1 Tax=Diphasiastrum complanatum TaxID=34168 RepID=A0ACC2AXD4_DIPCM|nr:hypothetical protein O6H91_19G082700 [Diphasiastrum complanatum]